MKKIRLVAVLALLLPTVAYTSDAKVEITELLHQFLAGATRNDASIHQQFWAEDLVYTSSAGARFGKAELMVGVTNQGELSESDITMRYAAEDVHIRIYEDVAALTFTLIGQSDNGLLRFYNSGTLVRGSEGWQAVVWQATRASD
ncbi:MAG: nuclear transport factor 2 family protein [Alkalimonas sp.]|nr:nuclear transport factor 2 family protein [Alkalimonas sp.]